MEITLQIVLVLLLSPFFSFWCREDWCDGHGMYISDHCHRLRHSEEANEEAAKCALMITDFPSKKKFTMFQKMISKLLLDGVLLVKTI